MQIFNSKLCGASKCMVYSTVNRPWWMSMLFYWCGLAVAWRGRFLHFGAVSPHWAKLFRLSCKIWQPKVMWYSCTKHYHQQIDKQMTWYYLEGKSEIHLGPVPRLTLAGNQIKLGLARRVGHLIPFLSALREPRVDPIMCRSRSAG